MPSPAAEAEARALRARTLAGRLPQSSEPLAFYAALIELQRSVAATHPRVLLREPAPFHDALDAEAAADAMPALLTGLLPFAPPPVVTAVRAMLEEGHAEWRHLAHTYWRGERDGDPLRLFLAEALLQPFAESAARHVGADRPDVGAAFRRPMTPPTDSVCRICADRPVVAVLREEAHGARRSFVCGFCLTEWAASRIACPSCGEQQFDKLAVYRAEELPGVRVDACDTCRTYLKTIDLTLDATAIPVVDDIATVTLDLWAREQGYHRLRSGLLRL